MAGTFEHGTLVAYKHHGCKCDPCTAANRRYEIRRRLLIADGRWQPLVDAQPVRDHINQLRANGLGPKRMAELVDVSLGAIVRVLYPMGGRPPSSRVRRTTAAALLALRADLDSLAPGARVDASGTRRRIQALCCLGWSLTAQADQAGISRQTYSDYLYRDQLTARTARIVREVYAALSMSVAPDGIGSARARREAQRKGWHPPFAWEDGEDLIDVPESHLETELARRAAAMCDEDLRRSATSYKHGGERSPLVVAAALEWRRRLKAPKQDAA